MKENKLVSAVIVTRNRKEDLVDCIKSLFTSDYKNIEIIIVDNDSDETVDSSWWNKKTLPIKIVKSQKNIGAAGGRNLGLKHAKGEYVLFMDDDAVADKHMVSALVETLSNQKLHAGIGQPKIYDKDKKNELQGTGHGISLWTGRLYAWGVREEDKGQYDSLREIPMAGCIWMVKKEVFDKIGNYDEEYFIPYEDSDFSIRARNFGYKIYCVPQAKAWHRGKKTSFVHPAVEWLGITSAERSYRVSRNKIIFMSKHAGALRFLLFLLLFLPIYAVVHSVIILASKRIDILLNYWKGLASGLKYSFYYSFKSYARH